MPRVEKRREKSQMIGDALREIAILLMVFLPLDAYFQHNLTGWTFVYAALMAGALMAWGMILEGKDE